MERIHKIGISIGILILILVALYSFLPDKEPRYTSEATVELIRVDAKSPVGADERDEAEEMPD